MSCGISAFKTFVFYGFIFGIDSDLAVISGPENGITFAAVFLFKVSRNRNLGTHTYLFSQF